MKKSEEKKDIYFVSFREKKSAPGWCKYLFLVLFRYKIYGIIIKKHMLQERKLIQNDAIYFVVTVGINL